MEDLTYLDLRDSALEDAGAVHVASALRTAGSRLQILDMSGNEIAEGGASEIARALPVHAATLTRISLEENEFGSPGIRKLAVCSHWYAAQPVKMIFKCYLLLLLTPVART